VNEKRLKVRHGRLLFLCCIALLIFIPFYEKVLGIIFENFRKCTKRRRKNINKIADTNTSVENIKAQKVIRTNVSENLYKEIPLVDLREEKVRTR
jgi:hypothetical protein